MDVPLCTPLIRNLSKQLEEAQKEDSAPAPWGEECALWMPCGMEREPFGDTPYTKIIWLYDMQARQSSNSGAASALLFCSPCLSEARAAAFGAAKNRIKLVVSLAIDEEGNTAAGTSLLSSLVTLQGLGVSQLAVLPKTTYGLADKLWEAMFHSTIPLGLVLDAQNPTLCQELIEIAQTLPISCIYTVGNPSQELLHRTQAAFSKPKIDLPHPKERTALIPACSSQPFFLGEDFSFSEPIHCSLDMSEEFLTAEETGCDILQVVIDTQEDAYNLGLNAHMARLPLCVVSHSLPYLEWALLHYHGRAVLDSCAHSERDAVEQLAHQYNAVLL